MIKQDELRRMYGTTPESFKHRVSFALKETEEKPVKKFTLRTALIAAAVLIVLMAVAYAAFPSQVAQIFGQHYGEDTKQWLEQGDVAVVGRSHTMGDVEFTVDEVVYRDNSLYGVGTIRVKEGGSAVLVAADHEPSEPFGYDIYGEGGSPETAPADAPTIAQVAKDKGGKIYVVSAIPDKIGVDGGAMLSPESLGSSHQPLRDGSIRFTFEAIDATAIAKGTTYTIDMWSSICEMNENGQWLEDTKQGEVWTVELSPTPMAEATQAAETPATSVDPAVTKSVTVITPDEYAKTGTMPIFAATARDFGKEIMPEWFNQSGVKSQSEYSIVFNDQAELQLAPEALFYGEYDGTYDASFLEPENGPDIIPKGAMSYAVNSLASSAHFGWPVTGETFALEKEQLTNISLGQAKQTLEALLSKLNVKGYACDYALDMSAERIRTLGEKWNAAIDNGDLWSNAPRYDYSLATAADEGYYLSYHKPGDEAGSGRFSVYAYVTERGVVSASIRDMYVTGEVVSTPEKLIEPSEALDALNRAIAQSQHPEQKVAIVKLISLCYAPMRADNKQDGMVMAPAWQVCYQDISGQKQGHDRYAVFSAVDGTALEAPFF